MVSIPAVCDNCDAIFNPNFLKVAPGAQIFNLELSNNKAGPCPHCGGTGHIVDGVFNIVSNTIEVLNAPQRTIEELTRLSEILKSAQSNNSTPEQLAEKIQNETPEFSSLLKLWKNEDFRFLFNVILAVISIAISVSGSDKEYIESNSNVPEIEVGQVINHIYQFNSFPSSTTFLISPTKHKPNDFPIKQMPIQIEKIGRNKPCPCNSGTKYKYCHGR